MNNNLPNGDENYNQIISLLRSLEIKSEALLNIVQKLEYKVNDIQKKIDNASVEDDAVYDLDPQSINLLSDNVINDLAQEIITSKNMGLAKDTPINHVSLTIDLSKKEEDV
jgi:hypothetical protein